MLIGHDVEVFVNYFCTGIEDYSTNNKILLEISEERNQIHEIYNYYTNYKGQVVSFNGVHYDNLIVCYILKNYNKLRTLSNLEITRELKIFSDVVILDSNYEVVSPYKNFKKPWVDVDLYLFWSKMFRLANKISLKGLGISLGYPVVQELPFHPSTVLTVEDLPKLRNYNLAHDLGILRLLYDNMKKDVDLRAYIGETLNIECMSMDAPKIASEILLKDYCDQLRLNPYNVRKWRFVRNVIPLRDTLVGFEPNYELDIFKSLFKEINGSYDTFSKKLLFKHKNTNIILSYGIGGLHSVNNNEKYYTTDEELVITSDVASLYPNLIINYKCIRFLEVLLKYTNVKAERLIAKYNKEKAKDTLFKLILNAISGMLDNSHSWLYFPEGALRMRLIGQLILTKFIEKCAMRGWKVVSANTDGIEVVIPKEDYDEYIRMLNETAGSFNLELDHALYDFIIYKDVNNYIARTDDGSVKQKGLFVVDPVLGKSTNNIVIAKALNAYYTEGVPFEKFVREPEFNNLHIYDYCKSNKIEKQYKVFHNGVEQQRLNRYYFQRGAAYLYKIKKGGNYEHVNVGQGVVLFNDYCEKTWEEYNINYAYYAKACRNIVDEIDNYNQLTLF